ncbi:MAG: mitochondrial fission ELM1 family protein [Alphaproteobacteria bacterium]|nr:mitochondrial fission ELM1 family protein [Alphaproteobacteria bacterium]
MSEFDKTCWIITEGLAGTENQCIGIADALGILPVVKRITLKSPWRQLSPWLRYGHKYALASDSDSIKPPYPDILIASGRKSIGIALHVKKASSNKTFLVQVQDPRIDPRHFDLVVVPQHDPTRGDNVLVTTGALHRITHEKLDAEKQKFGACLDHLPYPRVAVLIGGSSKAHRMTAENAALLSRQLLNLKDKYGAGLMVTASRRTGEENIRILKEALSACKDVFFWDSTGDNPYFAFLGFADHIIVTEDSVSMISEALSTGKPIAIVPLEGGAKRLNLFHRMLREQSYTRPFTGSLETWSYTPPNDMLKVVTEIKKRIETCPKRTQQKS